LAIGGGLDCPQGPSTPMLMRALERGHTVHCTIRFFHNRRDGQEEKYMEIVGTDGGVVGLQVETEADEKSDGLKRQGEARQTIQYAFHKLKIDHVGEDGASSAHFDWSGANQA